MGTSAAAGVSTPRLEIQLADIKKRESLGTSVEIRPLVLDPLPNDELPAVREPKGFPLAAMSGGLNHSYYREMRDFVLSTKAFTAFGFLAQNKSATAANGVRAEFHLKCLPDLQLAQRHPRRPVYRHDSMFLSPTSTEMPIVNPDVWFRQHGDHWLIGVDFGKVQPGASVWTANRLLIGTTKPMEVALSGQLFGDNFEPMAIDLRVVSNPEHRAMTVEDLQTDRDAASEHSRDHS
jgi:hypothetical protein